MKTATWVLVADGGSARLFEQNAAAELQELDRWDTKKPASKKSCDDSLDLLRKAQKLFARRLATTINRRRGEFQSLVVVASPRTVGDLKDTLETEVKGRLSEIHRDWTQFSATDLQDHLAGFTQTSRH